jgi:FtsZ-binding cell division protein ZapB
MSDIVERLLKDAESHYEVARSADMRPEDTLNWAHGQNCQEAADTITRLTAEVEWHKKNSDKWQDTQSAHLRKVTRLTAEVEKLKKEIIGRQAHDRMQVREIKHLTAEVAEYEAAFDAQWNADMAGVQMWREAHPGNDMVLPDRTNFTAWILAEIVVQRADNEKLRVTLRECEAELNAYYRMEYPSDHPYAAGSRIACVKVVIDCEEGEGL